MSATTMDNLGFIGSPGTAKKPATFTVVLRIVVDDAEGDDPRLWNYDELLAAPVGEDRRFTKYVHGCREYVEPKP